MSVHRYPARALTGDYFRSAVGLTVGFGVLLSVPPSPVIIAVFGGVIGLFGFFGLRTLQRHMMKVAVTDQAISNAGFGTRALSWDELETVKLRYFGTKRQTSGNGGFMQLTLKGGGTSLTFESSLDGFDYIAWRAAKAARDNGVSLDPMSAGNFLAMGLDTDGEMPPPEA